MHTFAEFLKTGKYGALHCGAQRSDILAVIGQDFKQRLREAEECWFWSCLTVCFDRGPAMPIESGTVSGFGLYLDRGDAVSEKLLAADFDLSIPMTKDALFRFMNDRCISFKHDSDYAVTMGGVLVLYDGPTINSLIRPCVGTHFFKDIVYMMPWTEGWIRSCESTRDRE